MSPLAIAGALFLDAFALVFAIQTLRWIRRTEKKLPVDNWRPSDDDARSGRRITLFIYPKKERPHGR